MNIKEPIQQQIMDKAFLNLNEDFHQKINEPKQKIAALDETITPFPAIDFEIVSKKNVMIMVIHDGSCIKWNNPGAIQQDVSFIPVGLGNEKNFYSWLLNEGFRGITRIKIMVGE